MQELVEIVRADIGEDAAVFLLNKVPGRPGGQYALVGPQAEGLDDLSDGASLDEFAGFNSRPAPEALAVAD